MPRMQDRTAMKRIILFESLAALSALYRGDTAFARLGQLDAICVFVASVYPLYRLRGWDRRGLQLPAQP